MYYIVDKKDRPLSGFNENNTVIKQQLKFRSRDCISFSTIEEAQKYLDYIIKKCRQSKQAEKLTIKTYCNW